MDWNARKTYESRGGFWIPQVTSAGGFSQADTSTPNFYISSGSNQITNTPTSIKYILFNNPPFQNSNVPNSLLPRLLASDKKIQLKKSPPSYSDATAQMATNNQNPGLSRNMHFLSTVQVQGSSANSMPRLHQSPINSFGNQVRTLVNQQAPPNSLSLKKPPTLVGSYYLNGSSVPQTDARMPFNSASSQYITPQQNVQCFAYSSANSGPNQSISTTLQSQLCAPDPMNPALYAVHSLSDSKNAAQITTINSSPLDQMPPMQGSPGQYVLQGPVANMANEQVQSYPPLIVQSSNLYPAPPEQKCLSFSSAPNTNEESNISCLRGLKAMNQLCNDLAKALPEVENSHPNNMSTSGAIHPTGPSPQTSRTLQQENNIDNSLGFFPENISKNEVKNKMFSFLAWHKRQLQKNSRGKQKFHQLALQNKQVSGIPNYNPTRNFLCPPSTTNPSLVNNAQQFPSVKTTPNQSSSNSQSSSQIKDDSLLPQKTKQHLLPILCNMLKGTADENMIFEVGGEKNKDMNVHNNSCSNSNGSMSEDYVNVDTTIKLNSKTTAAQEANISGRGVEQLQKIPGKDGLFNNFKLNKNSVDQYLKGNVQNSSAQGSSLPVKQDVEKLDCSASAYVKQQSETTSLQKTGNDEITSISSSSFSVPKVAEAVGERSCSLEELKTILPLWRKVNPSSFTAQSTEASCDGNRTTQILENSPNTLQLTVERTQSYVASTFGKNLDGVCSNLSKGYEPQVAIVTPLILSKKGSQDEVQKSTLSLLDIFIKKNSIRIEELLSAELDTDKEKNQIVCSSASSCKHEDLSTHPETSKSPEKDDIAKAGTNCLNNLNHEISNNAPLKSEQQKLNSDDANYLITPPQKSITPQKCDPNFDEPNNTGETELNDSIFQISSICSLVQGDACYNSQIAKIFNSNPSKSNPKVDPSEEHRDYIQYNEEESGLLKNDPEMSILFKGTSLPSLGSLSKALEGKPEDFEIPPKPQCDESSIETNVKNSEEGNDKDLSESSPHLEIKLEQDTSYSCNTDVPDQEVSDHQKGPFSTSFNDIVLADGKEFALEHTLGEDKPACSGSNIETSLRLLDSQLTELSEEFPYGIGYLNMAQGTDCKEPLSIPTEKGGKEDTRTYEEGLEPCQIKIEILNSQQMKEVFPDHSQPSPNKLDGQITTDSKGNLGKDNVYNMKSNPGIDVDNKEEGPGKTEERTFCCLAGWIASGYKVEPCSCKLAKGSSLKQATGLSLESKDRPKFRDNEGDHRLKNEVNTSIIDADNKVFSGDPSCKVLNKTSGQTETLQVKNEPPKVEEAGIPLSLPKNLESQDPHEQVMGDSQYPPRPMVGMNETYRQIYGRKTISNSQEWYHSSPDFKKIMAKKLRKMKSEKRPFDRVVKSKSDTGSHHRQIETKYNMNYERYKIKRDTSETRMIKGPISSLKRQLAKEKKRKALGIQPSNAISSSALHCVNVSKKQDNSEHNPSLYSQEDLIKKKFQKRNLEIHYGYRKVPKSESICPKNIEHVSEKPVKKINLEKYAYSKEKKNARKNRNSHLDTRSPTSEKERGPPFNTCKPHSAGRESTLDGQSRNKRPERSFSDKCFKRRNSLSIFLQKEQKNYLNRVAFKRTAQKTIYLTSLESLHSKSDWRVGPSSFSGALDDNKKGSSSCQIPEAERPQMLEFKMCPDILFRKSVSEENISEAKKLPDKSRTSVTEVKSKREDWLNYRPVKRKTEENEAKVNDAIPLEAAIKLLEGSESPHVPVKDSKATFETYRKMHLEKRSRSVDGSPLI